MEEAEGESVDPGCSYCGGLGYIGLDVPVHHGDFGKLVPCECRLEILEGERLERLESVSGLGPALRGKTFDDFVVIHRAAGRGSRPVSNRAALEAARGYAESPDGWLVIAGGNGAGKTHLAAAIANYRLERGRPALFVVAPDLLDHLRASYAPDSPVTYDERFHQICATPLLILDDLGAQQCTEWAWEKLYQILTRRRTDELPLVVTTNLDVSDPRALNRRISSRLSEEGWVRRVLITAPDWRRQPVNPGVVP